MPAVGRPIRMVGRLSGRPPYVDREERAAGGAAKDEQVEIARAAVAVDPDVLRAVRVPGLENALLRLAEGHHGRPGRHVEQQDPPVVLAAGFRNDLPAVVRKGMAADAGSSGQLGPEELGAGGLAGGCEI